MKTCSGPEGQKSACYCQANKIGRASRIPLPRKTASIIFSPTSEWASPAWELALESPFKTPEVGNPLADSSASGEHMALILVGLTLRFARPAWRVRLPSIPGDIDACGREPYRNSCRNPPSPCSATSIQTWKRWRQFWRIWTRWAFGVASVWATSSVTRRILGNV